MSSNPEVERWTWSGEKSLMSAEIGGFISYDALVKRVGRSWDVMEVKLTKWELMKELLVGSLAHLKPQSQASIREPSLDVTIDQVEKECC